jgi:hypothetical protein
MGIIPEIPSRHRHGAYECTVKKIFIFIMRPLEIYHRKAE